MDGDKLKPDFGWFVLVMGSIFSSAILKNAMPEIKPL
jgi:hypothetical protein